MTSRIDTENSNNLTTAPYGSWKSLISSNLIVGDSVRLGQVRIDGSDVYWTEGRPKEEGRDALVRANADGKPSDVICAPYSARTRAHEYGGGSFLVTGKYVFFCNNEDQQIYRITEGGTPQAVTNGNGLRYADVILDARRQRLIAIREDHRNADHEAINTVVAIDMATSEEIVMQSGHDFYSSPRLSRDGATLAWLSWDHPNMPWDGTQLWQAGMMDNGTLAAPQLIAGSATESIFQPEWSAANELHFISDRSDWWNLYRYRNGQVQALHPMAADFGQAQWIFGMSTYGFDELDRIVCTYMQNGRSYLAMLDPQDGKFETIPTPYHAIASLQIGKGFAAFIGGAPTIPESVVQLDLHTGQYRALRKSTTLTVEPENLSMPEAIEFPTEDGHNAHAFFYKPCNPAFQGPAGSRPPLLVFNHGGPTAMTTATLSLPIQYWTSRGFAVIDVNYGGSSGFGRAYRQRLVGKWGIVDVDDSVNAARYLIARGDIDAEQVTIRGGSAGGYTALCALTFRRFFKAGASYYGIGDLTLLVSDTHKFESRYMDSLVGPYPDQKQLYFDRSPINFTDRLESPLILFQGLKDKAVPPNQAQTMFDAVKAKGIPVAYITFEHEQHGFRRAENIKRALDAELYFYAKVFGFVQADEIEPVQIENLAPTNK
jgi:dipeptidyl aminopeptidase/acylaminoacyl peptidase